MSGGQFIHPFHDIELEADADDGMLVKILSLDGRRFTYLVRGIWNSEAEHFIRQQIDLRMVGDLIIERNEAGRLTARESPKPLKKHG